MRDTHAIHTQGGRTPNQIGGVGHVRPPFRERSASVPVPTGCDPMRAYATATHIQRAVSTVRRVVPLDCAAWPTGVRPARASQSNAADDGRHKQTSPGPRAYRSASSKTSKAVDASGTHRAHSARSNGVSVGSLARAIGSPKACCRGTSSALNCAASTTRGRTSQTRTAPPSPTWPKDSQRTDHARPCGRSATIGAPQSNVTIRSHR